MRGRFSYGCDQMQVGRIGIFGLCLLLCLAGSVLGQRGGRRNVGDEADRAGEQMIEMSQMLLTDYLVGGQELTAEDNDAINEALRQQRVYQGRFNEDQKAAMVLVQALLAHYADDSEQAFTLLRQAQALANQNGDVNETAIVLGLHWKNYDVARAALQARQGGELARVELSEPTIAAQMPDMGAIDQVADANDNVSDAGTTTDPNGNVTVAAAEEPEEPRSRFSQYTTSRDEARGSNQRGGRGRQPANRPGPGGPGAVPMGPGMAMGPMAPVGPGMMPGMPGGPGTAQRPPARDRTRQPARTEDAFSASVLELPVGFMPYEMLGQSIGELQLQNVNGSFFAYKPDGNQLLCILLWALPEDGEEISSGRSNSRNNNRGEMTAAMGMMMPALGNMPSSDEDSVFEVKTDLGETLDQFRDLYSLSQMTGVGQQLAVNVDLPGRRGDVVKAMMGSAWPWSNCMANNPFNRQSWQLEGAYSPVMLLVGADGTIRYAGPIGGFLPQMLMKQEVAEVMAARTEGMPTADGGLMQGLMNMAGQMLQSGSSRNGTGGQSAATAAEAVEETVAEAPPVQQRESNSQAANILRGAQAQRALSPRRACQLCDDVLEQYPDSLQAEEARLMIESILRRNSRLREEREGEGLYVGP